MTETHETEGAKAPIRLNLGRLADAKSEFPLLASGLYFALIESVALKPGNEAGKASFNWKLRVLNEGLQDDQGQPLKQKAFSIFHNYSATKTENFNPDTFTKAIVTAVSQDLLDKWEKDGDIASTDVEGMVVKITVGIENERIYKDKATGMDKTSPRRNKIEKFLRLSDEEAAQIQVPA